MGWTRLPVCLRTFLWLSRPTWVSGDIGPGPYLVLHRQSGQYLLGNGTLGSLADPRSAQWSLPEHRGPGQFLLEHAGTGSYLSPAPEAQSGVAVTGLEAARPWRVFPLCEGTCVALVDPGGGDALTSSGRAAAAAPLAAWAPGLWILSRPCPQEGRGPPTPQDCFPPGGDWGASGDDCCAERYGPRGKAECFDQVYTFERCCPGARGRAPPPAPGAGLAPRVLCSGERLDGEARSVLMADLGGDFGWVGTSALLRDTGFSFAPAPARGPSASLHVVEEGLPQCGGARLFGSARELLPATELHMVEFLEILHAMMLQLAENASRIMPHLPHDVYYLPFFPFLLITLHRTTQVDDYLHCLHRTVAFLGQVQEWRRNAGYDFVLALGYQRPWEFKVPPGSRLHEDAYHLAGYDPRFANTMVLATHDVFFGDRHAVLYPSQGGAAYRNLRNIVVPLPFSLNCTDWGRSLGRRLARPPRFRVAFVGSRNGASRDLVWAAAERLRRPGALPPQARGALAVRFVDTDEDRGRLAGEPEALRRWFGGAAASFDGLLRESSHCLVLPGDVSDLALRFFHAVSVGCVPVLVGGPSQVIPLPFRGSVAYERFARFATVRNVDDATALLRGLLADGGGPGPAAPPPRLEDVQGLFMRHSDCGFPSGEPFLHLLAKEILVRAEIWGRLRWSH